MVGAAQVYRSNRSNGQTSTIAGKRNAGAVMPIAEQLRHIGG